VLASATARRSFSSMTSDSFREKASEFVPFMEPTLVLMIR
jgi:hypothetical protein